MRTEFLNGRRCASVEKFTELAVMEEDHPTTTITHSTAPTTLARETVFLAASSFPPPNSTMIPPPNSGRPLLAGNRLHKDESPASSSGTTFFGAFAKQPQQPNLHPAAIHNNRVRAGSARGVQQKMKAPNGHHNYQQNGGPPRPTATSNGHHPNNPKQQEAVYRPESLASTAHTQKTYEKLAEVYSSSTDTVQFAGNLRTFISEHVHYSVWIGLAVAELLFGLVFLFIGALNLPMCEIQPLIPVYLMLAGVVLIIHGVVRAFASIPSPRARRPQPTRSRLHRDLCLYAIEGIVLLAMVVVVILGCVWVYGARYVHFHEGIFEEDYCNGFIYWAAWWSVTIHLVALGLLIFAGIFVLIYGTMISDN